MYVGRIQMELFSRVFLYKQTGCPGRIEEFLKSQQVSNQKSIRYMPNWLSEKKVLMDEKHGKNRGKSMDKCMNTNV
jgi:hypothetical protein